MKFAPPRRRRRRLGEVFRQETRSRRQCSAENRPGVTRVPPTIKDSVAVNAGCEKGKLLTRTHTEFLLIILVIVDLRDWNNYNYGRRKLVGKRALSYLFGILL